MVDAGWPPKLDDRQIESRMALGQQRQFRRKDASREDRIETDP